MYYTYLSWIVRLQNSPLFHNCIFVSGFTIVCSHLLIHTLEGLFAVRLQVGCDYFSCGHVRTMLDSLFGVPLCMFALLKIQKEPTRVCVRVCVQRRLMCAIGVTKHACA